MPQHIAAKIRPNLRSVDRRRARSRSTTPKPNTSAASAAAASACCVSQRRQTDAQIEPPPSEQLLQLLGKRRSTGGRSLIGFLRRSNSEEKVELKPEVQEFRRRAPRGIAAIDDFPQLPTDEKEQQRFELNQDFESFHNSHCFSVMADNFGHWPMAPEREMAKATPATRLELTLSARNLKDKDVFSKSDPLCVVFEAFHSKSNRVEFGERGRTECVRNCLNPEWNNKIIVDYLFEERQQMKFEIYDIDSKSQSLSHHDFLGRAECDLAEIVAAPFSTFTIPLSGLGGQKGVLIVHADELNEGQKESMKFIIHGRNLDKKDFFGKSDPFLNFYRILGNGSRQLVHRTEVIKKTLNPEWKPFNISVRALCQGNKDSEFVIECFDYDNDGGHDLIGVTRTTVNKLACGEAKELPLINEKKQRKKGDKYKNSGVLRFEISKLEKEYTFLDFIHGGMQLDFTVSVDFTASNGPVTVPTSLHFCDPSYKNEYQMAIKSVLEICQSYNKTKLFNAFGFGAQLPPQYTVSHLFPLNLQQTKVQGIEGVMYAYNTCLRAVTLYGPTNFAPTINEAAKQAAFYPKDGSRYQVLLIITDGVISDMQSTKSAIVAASTLPLSIIIIGVGGADFEKMDSLDSDDQLLVSNGRTARRDIVQFVPFRRFVRKDLVTSPYEQERLQYMLAKEVLAEVPEQVVSYMKMQNIIPRPPSEVFSGPANPVQGPYPVGAEEVPPSSAGPYPSPSAQFVLPGQYRPVSADAYAGCGGMPYPPQATGPYPPQSAGPYPSLATAYPVQSAAPYPDAPPTSYGNCMPPPAYDDAVNAQDGVAVGDINLQFQNQMNIKPSAPVV